MKIKKKEVFIPILAYLDLNRQAIDLFNCRQTGRHTLYAHFDEYCLKSDVYIGTRAEPYIDQNGFKDYGLLPDFWIPHDNVTTLVDIDNKHYFHTFNPAVFAHVHDNIF